MPNLIVNTTIKAPENIEIELVRLDTLSTSNTYRTFFEIFLSASSALLGVILSVQSTTTLHWVFLAAMAISSAVFLYLSIATANKAKVGS